MNSDAMLSVLGTAVLTLPYMRWYARERSGERDDKAHRELMAWLGELERAGKEQAHDIETLIIRARFARSIAPKS